MWVTSPASTVAPGSHWRAASAGAACRSINVMSASGKCSRAASAAAPVPAPASSTLSTGPMRARTSRNTALAAA